MPIPKIAKGQYPTGHTADDFECFGPPATKDGESAVTTTRFSVE